MHLLWLPRLAPAAKNKRVVCDNLDGILRLEMALWTFVFFLFFSSEIHTISDFPGTSRFSGTDLPAALFLLSFLALCCNVDFSCTRPDLKIAYRRQTWESAVKDDFLQQTPLTSHSSWFSSLLHDSVGSGWSTPGFLLGPLEPSSLDWDNLQGGASGASSQRLRPWLGNNPIRSEGNQTPLNTRASNLCPRSAPELQFKRHSLIHCPTLGLN